MASVEIAGLRKNYGDVVALRDINLSIAAGSFYTLLGPSGCGKTTLLRTIAGFHDQDAGSIRIADGAVVMVTFGDVVWTGAVFTARAALVYNVSKGNRAVAVFDFGAEKVTPPSGEFRVVIPPAARDSAILRFN